MTKPGIRNLWMAGSIAVAVIAVGIGLVLLLRSGTVKGYSQSTPDDTLRTAILMVQNGEAEKVPTLIHAEKPELRAVLNRLGEMFSSTQQLASEINRSFPDDVRKIKEQFARELAEGTAPSIMNMLAPGGPTAPGAAGNPRGFDPEALRQRAEKELSKRQVKSPPKAIDTSAPSGNATVSVGGGASGVSVTTKPAGQDGQPTQPARLDPEKQFQALAARILADPFSWITENAAKLSTEKIADDQAAVLYDGKPVPPLGLTMRQVNDKWYFVLPLNSPGLSQYMPQTRHEWSIIGSLIRVLDNALKDVAREVRLGKVQRMDKLAESVGEKAFIPGAMVAVMYGKEMDVRQRREKAVSAFKKRWNTWSDKREGDDPALLSKLVDAVNRLAVEELDHSVRLAVKDPQVNRLPEYSKLTDLELTQLVEGWISNKSVRIDLTAPLEAKSVGEAATKIDAWFSGKVQKKKK